MQHCLRWLFLLGLGLFLWTSPMEHANAQTKDGRAAKTMPEPEPSARDEKTGVAARITRWFGDKAAAVGLRFDDSSPTHILIAVPLLTQYKMVGTFLINPGNDGYKKYKEKWETEAIQGGHEFGNHTFHHRSAKDDDEADYEIGECSRYIWALFPNKSKLLAFRSGGGTTWNIKKTWGYYMEKWHLVFDENSAGVATSGGKNYVTSMALFQERLDRAVQGDQWVTFYYHQIGLEKGLNITEAFFREQMEYLHSRQAELWFGGVAQIHKYQAERRSAKLSVGSLGERKVEIQIACGTSPELYDQPLTVEVSLPNGWKARATKVADAKGNAIPMRIIPAGDEERLRFEIQPIDTRLTVSAQ
jgi:hypothetical protein